MDLPGGQSPRAVSESTIWSIPSRRRLRLGTITGVNNPFPIPEGTSILDRTDLGEHGLRSRAVTHVLSDQGATMVVTQVLAQPRVQHGLQHVLGELVPQLTQTRPGSHPCSLGLGEQPLGELFLIDDPHPVTRSIISSVAWVMDSDTALPSRLSSRASVSISRICGASRHRSYCAVSNHVPDRGRAMTNVSTATCAPGSRRYALNLLHNVYRRSSSLLLV